MDNGLSEKTTEETVKRIRLAAVSRRVGRLLQENVFQDMSV